MSAIPPATLKCGWIGVDLDATLAEYTYGKKDWSPTKIGAPIPVMVERVKRWRAEGREVRIFTARIAEPDLEKRAEIRGAIARWCVIHLGEALPITCKKDFGMIELWDDRAVRVEANTGRQLCPSSRGLE